MDVAQSVERRSVAAEAAGSKPVIHPKKISLVINGIFCYYRKVVINFDNMQEREQVPLQERLRAMNAGEKVQFFRGIVSDYSTRLDKVIAKKFAKAENMDAATRERLLDAFQKRVEDFLANPGAEHGGSALDHLPQTGLLSQEQYNDLHGAAAAMAAEIMKAAGAEQEANAAYASFGRIMAKQHLETELN